MAINLMGETFGRWSVIELSNTRKGGELCFICRCECGNEKVIRGSVLRKGVSKSCGCLRKEVGANRGRASRKHGEARNGKYTSEYQTWGSMLSRCRNLRHKQYRHYGGRGITVCDRWLTYENFLADMGRRPTAYHSIDRIDNDGNYSPENCRWATWQEQNNNKRQSPQWREVTINGENKLLSDWLRIYGVTRGAYYKRRGRGWSEETAITTPLKR